MDSERLLRACERLPVLPLSRIVLMPGALLPLHVFEPRYRALLAHSLGDDRILAIGTLRPRRGVPDDVPRPLFATVGVGEVVAHEPLPDGRSHIVIRYLGAARLLEELQTGEMFRMFRAQPTQADHSGAAAALLRLRVLVLQLGAVCEVGIDDADHVVSSDGIGLLHSLASRMLDAPRDRRAYLRSGRTTERVAMIEERLAAILAAKSLPRARS